MLKELALGLMLSVAAVSFAHADENPMASRIGNTVVVTNEDGVEIQRLAFNADGTVQIILGDGSESTGAWEVVDGELCITRAEGDEPECNPVDGSKQVGDSWDMTMSDGSVVKVEIVGGQE